MIIYFSLTCLILFLSLTSDNAYRAIIMRVSPLFNEIQSWKLEKCGEGT